MAAQAQLEGRFLGGRPPYGYLLIDAGPHLNPAKAADGKRRHALAIDESAAAVVVRIFAEFLAGSGIYAIAEGLTRDGIPCPSAHDRGRNRHRCGVAWSKGAVRAILTNPRYTGRQVWNRQRKDEVLLDVHDVALGHTTKMRWNEAGKWIYSEEIVHPPIIDTETFQRAQDVLAVRGRGPCQHKPHDRRRAYALLVPCSAASATAACKGTGSTRHRTTAAGSLASTRSPTRSATRAMSTCVRMSSRPT
jgi:site-specific DNA recombinase